MLKDQLERWVELTKGTTREETTRAFAESVPIIARHLSTILDRLWKAYSEPPKDGNFLALQKELHIFSVTSMNEMMKEIMATKSFASLAGDAVESYLKTKIVSDRMMEEILKAMRIPTKTDIDELHRSIYGLSKKVDQLLLSRPGMTQKTRSGQEV